jgi:hypothetical protein
VTANPVLAENVKKYHDNGKLKEAYTTDKDSRKSGSYKSFYESGKNRIQCRYAKGKLNGPYTEYHEDGKPKAKKTFKQGKLSGKVSIYDSQGKVVHRAAFTKGKTYLYGDSSSRTPFEVYGAPRDEIVAKIKELRPKKYKGSKYQGKKYVAKPSTKSLYTAGSPRKQYLEDSLRELEVYRYLCGIGYELELDDQMNVLAQHAALISARNGKLSHTPSRPDDMPSKLFDLCRQGAKACNLHQEWKSMVTSIEGYMDDSDPTNIERVGHRAWCLSPWTKKTGLGEVNGYFGLHTGDRSRTIRGALLDTILFPNKGHFPIEYFGRRYAWSVTFPTGKYGAPKESELDVKVWTLDDEFMKQKELKLDYAAPRTESYGMGAGIIFRPVIKGSIEDLKVLVSIRFGPAGKHRVSIDYVVDFFSKENS